VWTRVSLWVMAAGRADRLDGRDGWRFRIADAQELPFAWKGVDYTAGIIEAAPAYLDLEVPPGNYVVWAERGPLTTHRAVLAVHDEASVVLRLLPAAAPRPQEPSEPERECEITIDGVRGHETEGGWPRAVVVHGSSAHCPVVHVAIRRRGAKTWSELDVVVASDGSWEATFPNDLKVECGSTVQVVATCTDDRTCNAKGAFELTCD
jgi:hypothetical protein